MPRRRWSDLSERTRRLLIAAAVADGALRVAALVDIKRQPATQIRGQKRVWAGAVAIISSAGVLPISYFVFGRRRQGPGGASKSSRTAASELLTQGHLERPGPSRAGLALSRRSVRHAATKERTSGRGMPASWPADDPVRVQPGGGVPGHGGHVRLEGAARPRAGDER